MNTSQAVAPSSGVIKKFQFKLVLLGDASVGKSCLVVRFVKSIFSNIQDPTIGAAFITQAVQTPEGLVNFEIWDTAGGAAAALVVYDITNSESFAGAKSWINELQSIDTPEICIVLVGNKLDLATNRTVSLETAHSYAESHNLLYFETSAKTGQSVYDIFWELAQMLPNLTKEENENPTLGLMSIQEPQKYSLWTCCFQAQNLRKLIIDSPEHFDEKLGVITFEVSPEYSGFFSECLDNISAINDLNDIYNSNCSNIIKANQNLLHNKAEENLDPPGLDDLLATLSTEERSDFDNSEIRARENTQNIMEAYRESALAQTNS